MAMQIPADDPDSTGKCDSLNLGFEISWTNTLFCSESSSSYMCDLE